MPIKPEIEEIEALAQQFKQPGPLSNDDRRQLPDIKDATRAPVYHFTTTVQLPWIIGSGELRPYPETTDRNRAHHGPLGNDERSR